MAEPVAYTPPFAEPANAAETEINSEFRKLFDDAEAQSKNVVMQLLHRVPNKFGNWYLSDGGWTQEGWRAVVTRMGIKEMTEFAGHIMSELEGARMMYEAAKMVHATGGEMPEFLAKEFEGQECDTPACVMHGTPAEVGDIPSHLDTDRMTGGIL